MRRVGEGGLVHPEGRRVTQALWRFLLICAAAALGETIAIVVGAYDLITVIGIIFGAAAYVLTNAIERPRGRGGDNVTYWRGRRIDPDDDKRKWN
jgi:hypothetical protein